MSSEIAIRVGNLSKCYQIYEQPRHRLMQMLYRGKKQFFREFWALDNISFEIKRGETVGIIGRNGSGKSTLLQLLCGTLNPTAGVVEINGKVAALLELGAGFNPEFTGRENVYMNAAILGLTHEEINENFAAIETFAEIGSFIDQPVKTYSSGMYVRLAFSVAVHTHPNILIVDEALAVGDARFQAKCLKRIKSMKESGACILFVSHDVGAVRTLCDRAIWLDAGKMRLNGPVFPVTAEYTEYIYADSAFIETEATDSPKDELDAVVEGGFSNSEKLKPINHWGTHTGTILSAGIYDANGVQKNVFMDREPMQVRIKMRPAPGIDRSNLSVSFSFKDLAGTDLIVGSTWDEKSTNFSIDENIFEVNFNLENCLNTGEYLLVAAVEDRAASTVQYYEYVEGAQYFSSVFRGNLSGKFIPRVTQSVRSE